MLSSSVFLPHILAWGWLSVVDPKLFPVSQRLSALVTQTLQVGSEWPRPQPPEMGSLWGRVSIATTPANGPTPGRFLLGGPGLRFRIRLYGSTA